MDLVPEIYRVDYSPESQALDYYFCIYGFNFSFLLFTCEEEFYYTRSIPTHSIVK